MFFLKPRANTIPSVPCSFRFNVLLSSCLLHPSCRQNVASSSKHDPICAMSVGSVKVLCVFFLSLVQTRSHLCHVGSVYSSHLVAKRGAPEQERTSPFHVGSVIVFCVCVFFLSLERARSHLCHVGSVCSSHLVCSTHLEEKRGAFEQERTSPFHVGSVKVLCVFLSTLKQARIHLCPVGSMCSSHLVCFAHLVDKRGALEQARTSLYHVG